MPARPPRSRWTVRPTPSSSPRSRARWPRRPRPTRACCARPSGRSAKRSSTTRTSGGDRPSPPRIASVESSTAVGTQYVYDFSEGSADMRELLGGKGANFAEMTRILGAEPEGLDGQVDQALARLEERTGKRLGDPDDPLLVSVRSGARESMPGMLDTVLNLGLNNDSVRG